MLILRQCSVELPNDEECDASKDDSSNAVRLKKINYTHTLIKL
jgi:hypothetical protein